MVRRFLLAIYWISCRLVEFIVYDFQDSYEITLNWCSLHRIIVVCLLIWSGQWCRMLSINLDYIFIGVLFMSIWVIIISTTSIATYSVECLGLKPYCLPDRSLEFSRYDDN